MGSTVPGDRLTLRLDAVPGDASEPELVADAPLLRFEAFVARDRLFGWVRLDADRLTDLLNKHEAVSLREAAFESLVDGSTRRLARLEMTRSSLIGVSVTGPRGDPALRRWTHAHPIAVQLGEYLMVGYAHATPGQDPLSSITERPPMVPLTDARLEFWPEGQRRRSWIGTMLFNRELADWIRVVTDEELELDLLRPTAISAAAS